MKWTTEEDNYVRSHFMWMVDSEIGAVLNRKELSVSDKRRELGLKRPTQGDWKQSG